MRSSQTLWWFVVAFCIFAFSCGIGSVVFLLLPQRTIISPVSVVEKLYNYWISGVVIAVFAALLTMRYWRQYAQFSRLLWIGVNGGTIYVAFIGMMIFGNFLLLDSIILETAIISLPSGLLIGLAQWACIRSGGEIPTRLGRCSQQQNAVV